MAAPGASDQATAVRVTIPACAFAARPVHILHKQQMKRQWSHFEFDAPQWHTTAVAIAEIRIESAPSHIMAAHPWHSPGGVCLMCTLRSQSHRRTDAASAFHGRCCSLRERGFTARVDASSKRHAGHCVVHASATGFTARTLRVGWPPTSLPCCSRHCVRHPLWNRAVQHGMPPGRPSSACDTSRQIPHGSRDSRVASRFDSR